MSNPGSSEIDVLSNDLVKEFRRGYPLENLRPLLRSSDPTLVATGVWIASELGERGQPLLNEVVHLINNPEKAVRFEAINCLLVWATPSNPIEIASVIRLIADPERSVRWKVMDFLARASEEQLRAGLSGLQSSEPESPRVRGLQWLLSPGARDPTGVITVLQGPDALSRKYAAVAAQRIAKDDKKPLIFAQTVDDLDVKNFADSSIELL